MKIYSLMLLVLFGTASCSKEEMTLPAAVRQLAQSYDCSCEPYIDLYRWQGMQVFVLQYSGPACNWIPTYIKADGTYLQMPANISLDQFKTSAVFIGQVWRCGK